MTNTETSRPWLDNFHSAIDARDAQIETWPMDLTGTGRRGSARVVKLLSALSSAGWRFEVTRNVSVGRSVLVTVEVTGAHADLVTLVREIQSQL